MTKLSTRHWALAAMIALSVALGVSQWRVAQGLADGVSLFANPHGESNTIRAGESYATRGFLYGWGLPDKKFGGRFPDRGYLIPTSKGFVKPIETHYPPGAEWLAGVGTIAFGIGHISNIRIIPILFGVAGLVALSAGLLRFFAGSPTRAVLAFAITAAFPMSYNMMHGLHHHEYTTALYMMQLGLLLAIVANGFRFSRAQGALLAALGFLQGWFSIDNIFIVCLSAIPIAIAWGDRQAPNTGLRQHVLLIMLPSAGYVLAHVLHVLEVIGYYGSVQATLQDFRRVAEYRIGAADPRVAELQDTMTLWWRYIVQWIPRKRFFGTPILENLTLFALLAALSHFWLRSSRAGSNVCRFTLDIPWGAVWGAILALLIPSAWIVVMKNHSIDHGNFIPRNFLLAYLIPVYTVIAGFRMTRRPPAGLDT